MSKGIPGRLCGREFYLKHLQAIKEEVQGGYCFSRAETARRAGRGKLERRHEHGVPVSAVFVYPLVRDFFGRLTGVAQ